MKAIENNGPHGHSQRICVASRVQPLTVFIQSRVKRGDIASTMQDAASARRRTQ